VKRLLDLSFRHKLPLWGATLVITSALAVSASLMLRAYDDLKQDLLISSASLGRTLATTLLPVLLNDDVWRAFQIVRAPVSEGSTRNPVAPDGIVVVDDSLRVIVSSRPRAVPMLADIRSLGREFQTLARQLGPMRPGQTRSIELPASEHLYVVAPIADEGAHLGTLIISHPKDAFVPRFFQVAGRGALVGLLVLAVLLPINWYWGRRMAAPLSLLASRMSRLGEPVPLEPEQSNYPYGDELGQLFSAYRVMVGELQKKRELERQMILSDRLAAIGRLTAAMAHEINNPLGGMLTAIDTLKRHGSIDQRTARTMSLIERGLNQIKETVGALLVEARVKSRDLSAQDFEDVRGLVAPEAAKKTIRVNWTSNLAGTLPLPANLVRQVLLNLVLNAIHAADAGGQVDCSVERQPDAVRLIVANGGRLLTQEQMGRLFEPFSELSESGHGLGLWASYQIVRQLGGRIWADRADSQMVFSVWLPTRSEA
jgi:signal transduction histidine kinase